VLAILCAVRGDDARADVSLPSWAGQATSTAAGIFDIPGFVAFCPIGGMLLSGAKAVAVEKIFGESSGATGVFMYLMPCLTNLIRDTADDFIDDFYDDIAGLIQVFLTVAVLFFGIALATGGVENFKREGMVFLLKVGFVVGLSQNLSSILALVYEVQDGLILAATGYVNTGSFLTGFSFLHCSTLLDVWMRADCLINTIIGVRIPAADLSSFSSVYTKITDPYTKTTTTSVTKILGGAFKSKGSLDDGLLAFFWNCFASGSILSLAAIVGLSMVYNMIMGLLKAANVYLTSLMGLAFMAISGGLLLPLMLMRSTYGYFNKWALGLLSLMIQPVVLFAFLNISLTAFDIVLFSGQKSLLHLMAGEKVDKGFTNTIVVEEKTATTAEVTKDVTVPFITDRYLSEKNAVTKAPKPYCLTNNLTMDGLSKNNFYVGGDVGGNLPTPIVAQNDAAADKPNDPRNFSMCIPYKVIDVVALAKARVPAIVLEDENKPVYLATDTPAQKAIKDDNALAKQFSTELVGGVVMAWLTSYIFVSILGMVPSLSRKLMGVG